MADIGEHLQDTHWFCRTCRVWMRKEAKVCRKCARVSRPSTRMTIKRKRERGAERDTAAILKRFGL